MPAPGDHLPTPHFEYAADRFCSFCSIDNYRYLMSKALFINSLIATGTECFQEIIFSSMETYRYRFILALDLT